MANYLILGRGYTGTALENLLVSHDHNVTCTSRSQSGLLRFTLEDETTWDNLPDRIDGTFITLPFSSLESARQFAIQVLPYLGKTVFMGTTSAFMVHEEHQVIREDSVLDPENQRNLCEAKLIDAGAICVHSAGIYGENRSPLNWIRDGRVTANDRYVNFIHVDDLSRLLYRAMLSGSPGARYIASDGNPMRWSEIVQKLENLYGIKGHPAKPSRRPSKRIDPRHTLESLDVDLKHPDVVQGIRAING